MSPDEEILVLTREVHALRAELVRVTGQADKLADALACVLNNPMGGYEQADNYIRAQGIGSTALATYRAHIKAGQIDGNV